MSNPDRSIYWIGTDEAGYGSRLGPLVVSASAWRVSNNVAADWQFDEHRCLSVADELDWHQVFSCDNTGKKSSEVSPAMQVLDSKKLYSSGKSLLGLQRVVSSMLHATLSMDLQIDNYSALSRATATEPDRNQLESSPYWLTLDSQQAFDLPFDWSTKLKLDAKSWSGQSIEPIGCHSDQIHENRFNEGLIESGNKATLLSRTTLKLAMFWLDHLDGDSHVIVDLDRHGGRKKYLPLLLEATNADWIEVILESPQESTYRWKTEHRTVYFRFCVGGERRFPVAMASIFSKLQRERAMECFNRFWCQQLPNLTPTAGYPVDAERFQADTNKLRAKLKISDHQFWRNA